MRPSTLSLIVASLAVALMVTSAKSATVFHNAASGAGFPVAGGVLPGANAPQTPSPLPPVPALVPEPASWALMLTGLALTGGAVRRRAKARA